MKWNAFFAAFAQMDAEELEKAIADLTDFGDADEVCEAINAMPTEELSDALYETALECGVLFTDEQLDEMGRPDILVGAPIADFFSEEEGASLTSWLDDQHKAKRAWLAEHPDAYAEYLKEE